MILAVIPARGGSRGLPRKNLRRLGGLPMIAWTIRAARGARRIDRTIVSTDAEEIARVAREHGAEVPFLRPPDLASDTTPTVAVIDHVVREIEAKGDRVAVVVTLQPTSPLRDSDLVDAAVELLQRSGARSVVSVASLGRPASVLGALDGGTFLPLAPSGAESRRQASPPAAVLTGAIYVTTRGLLAEGRLTDERPAALVTPGPAAIDIDDESDLRAARRALARGRAR